MSPSEIKEMEVQLKEAGSKADNSEKTVKDIALKAIERSGKMQVIDRERVKEKHFFNRYKHWQRI